MRRFFRADRDEDYSQIQYLMAKCIRLSQDREVLQRELLVSGERQQALQAEMELLSVRMRHKEHQYVALSVKHEQLLKRFEQQQQEQADVLQWRVLSEAEDSWRDESLLCVQLEQVSGDLQQLQSSETHLMGLVDELHQEAQSKAQTIEDLEMQLNSKSLALEELQTSHDALRRDLCAQRSAHRRTVQELQKESTESLSKLWQTAEQLEWLCEQQRRWMSCVRRLKDCLSGEKESLELQVSRLQVELDAARRSVRYDRPTQTSSGWDDEVTSDLQAEVDRWKRLYEDLLKLTTQEGQRGADGHLKPP